MTVTDGIELLEIIQWLILIAHGCAIWIIMCRLNRMQGGE